MKCLVCVTLAMAAFISFPSAAFTQTSKAPEDLQTTKNEILALDQQVNAAAVNGDLQTLGKIMSDDYVGVAPDGMILRKAMIAAHYQAGTLHYASVVNSDVEIHLHDDCAILTAIAIVKGHDGEIDLTGTYRIMRVFFRRGGAWQIVAFQATAMRPPAQN
jgi:ketosteroid isomerase-like protein